MRRSPKSAWQALRRCIDRSHPPTESGLLPAPEITISSLAAVLLTFIKIPRNFLYMAQEQGGQMPSSMGGLVQYYEADTGVELDPKTVIALGFMVAALGIALNAGVI